MRRCLWGLLLACACGEQGGIDCPPPTYDQCLNAYDGGTVCDRYFRNQARFDAGAACSLLFDQKGRAAASTIAEVDRLGPKIRVGVNGDADADAGFRPVAYIRADKEKAYGTGMDSLILGEFYRHAAFFPKKTLQAGLAKIAFDQKRDEWDVSNVVESCKEYVHEKYYDYTRFEDAVSKVGLDDHRAIFDIAYAIGLPPPTSAIGTRAIIQNGVLKGRDNTPFLPNVTFPPNRNKNGFFDTPLAPQMEPFEIQTQFEGATKDIVGIDPIMGKIFFVSLAHTKRKDMKFSGVAFEDATLAPALLEGKNYYQEDWAWHRDMNLRNKDVPDEVMFDFDKKKDDFRGLLEKRAETLRAIAGMINPKGMPLATEPKWATQWWLDPLWNPDPGAASRFGALKVDVRNASLGGPGLNQQPYSNAVGVIDVKKQATSRSAQKLGSFQVLWTCDGNPIVCLFYKLEAIDAAIEEALLEAKGLGCLFIHDRTANDARACDWSPREFTTQVLGLYHKEREDAYQRCESYTEPEQFTTSLKSMPLNLDATDGGPGIHYGAENYTTSPTKLEQYFTRFDEYLVVLKDVLGPVIDPVTGKARVVSQKADDYSMGGEWFGASASYDTGFEITNFESGKGCAYKERAYGHFTATVTALTADIDLFNANIDADDKKASLDVKALDMNIDVITETFDFTEPINVIAGGESEDKTFIDVGTTFVIVFVPVSLGAKVSGSLGVNYSVSASRTETMTNGMCSVASVKLEGMVEPFAQIDGEIYAAIDAIVLEAGIKGVLTIIRASVPITAALILGPSESDVNTIALTLKTGAALRFTFLSGHISVYVEVGICPFCTDAEAELIAWDGIHEDIPLFNVSTSFPLFALQFLASNPVTLPK